MEPVFFKWNDPTDLLKDIDGYFVPGGFAYEDRGRAGMVAARDPLLQFIASEAEKGKVVIGNCNGAQVLVESGLIPLDKGLRMSLARNAHDGVGLGFLNEWVWIKPSCAKDRCATSNWNGVMHMPMAHGEGRFTTKDKDVIAELMKNDQIAFSYCDEEGNVSEDPIVTPNGSMYAIAGICNAAGNVVALMPHPERTPNGDPYFAAMKTWIEKKKSLTTTSKSSTGVMEWKIDAAPARDIEIFIDTIITNNEERTVEQALRRIDPAIRLKQLRYLAPKKSEPETVLRRISLFNPNKEIAFVRRGKDLKRFAASDEKVQLFPSGSIVLLRRDEPDTGAPDLGEGSATGVCYVLSGIDEQKMYSPKILEVLANPHASTLSKLHVA
jgi:phosphoribosylformylglycinamidine synthase